jgi:hypothetical protein
MVCRPEIMNERGRGHITNTKTIFVGKFIVNQQRRRNRRRWEDNIKTYIYVYILKRWS